MSTRCTIATGLAVCLAVGLVQSHVPTAHAQTASSAQIWQGYVPANAYASVVIYPKRVLENPSIAKLVPIAGLDELATHAGMSPMEVEQAVVMLGPSADAAHGDPTPNVALICRTATAHEPTGLVNKWLAPAKAEETSIAGHKCFQRSHDGGHVGPGDVAICFLDQRTFILAPPAWMPEVLGAKDATSPLISAMTASDPAADATIIFVNNETIKGMAKSVSPQMLPGPLQSFAALPDLVRAVKLAIYTTPRLGLKFMFVGNDEASAQQIATMITKVQGMGQAFLPALLTPPNPEMSAERQQNLKYAAELAGKLVNGLVPKRSGKKVTVEFDDLGSPGDLVAYFVRPAIPAAKWASGIANLRQIALAMMAYETANGHFPPHAIYSRDGKPLLSWRVALLPFLGENGLYEQFHLDEPWDSPNNKPLVAKMPDVFESPGGSFAAGQTGYVVAVGKDTMFDGEKGTAISAVTDGTSNTILAFAVGPDKAVAWTKPDDLEFDPRHPLAGLGTIDGPGIPAALADGSVHTLPESVDADTFRWLILRNDGHVVDMSKF